ncbi:MAG: tetratricopeptide repeat protein [Planctomycetota bacterium]|jgi:tetratricopeptide (TPR) repeat protein
MNREKWFAIIVCPLAILLALWSYMDVYEKGDRPQGGQLAVVAPVVDDWPDKTGAERFVMNVARLPALPDLVPDSGRTILEAYSDLLPVEKAVLALPRALQTPVVLPPVSPSPWVPFYGRFRAKEIGTVPGAPSEEEPPEIPDVAEGEEPDEVDSGEVLESRKKPFIESEWDSLTLLAGGKWFGTISLTKEGRDRGLTKYHLLLSEHRELEFYFEKRNTTTGKIESRGTTSLKSQSIQTVEFADTIENRYWSRRVSDRVQAGDVPALLELGRWIREIAEEAAYVRTEGLDLAVATFEEALKAKPDDLEATLELGETLHRAFRFDDEVALYDEAIGALKAPEILARKARVLRKLDLHAPAERVLGEALTIAPGDTAARLDRAETRYLLGLTAEAKERAGWIDGAIRDFQEVQNSGTPEERTAAREGRARAHLARGEPEAAESLLGGDVTDEASLTTLGCARYARKNFVGAASAFEKALEVNPESARALTNLGITQAQMALDWAGIETAIENLEKARQLDPLNYFYPPLGLGFAEQRRGHREERPEHFAKSVDHYLTAKMALPTNPYVHYILGVSYLRDENYKEARREFLEALKLDYRFTDALLGVGTASLELGDWVDARAHLNRALQVEGESVFTRYRLGRAFLLSDDLPEAVRYRKAREQFEQVLKTDDQHVPSLNALGYIAYQLDDVETAYRRFGQARDLAPESKTDPDRLYADDSKARIADAQSRRLWVDSFDRPNSAKVANGWAQTSLQAVTPRVQNGAVVVRGRHPSENVLWLTRGSKTLNGSFIAVEAVVRWKRTDHVNNRFLIFQRRGKSGEDTWNQVGIEKNARGEVVVYHKKQSEKQKTRIIVRDDDGESLLWPDGEAVLRIERSNHKRGVFTLYLNEEQIGEVEAGIRRRAGTLELGFGFQATTGEQHDSRIQEVRIEQYVQ